ncbi:hypothetical protein BKA62DRAFT_741511 [Auriculariales sp. MPI-PUGE-AT-0066]|nr:hypothetical protein BKA62DRAFT_741511 [Auriculariales sp. MPI-PUGE-AT-0066]
MSAAVAVAALDAGQDPLTLTPLRAHYLKKTLISLQFARELDTLTNAPDNAKNTLSYLGPPFSPPPKGSPPMSFPFLRYMFNQFVLSFPFLAAAPKDFFPSKLQPFLASLMSHGLASADDFDDPSNLGDPEQDSRQRMLQRVEKQLSLLLVSGTKLVESEEVVRLSQRDLDRLEALAKRRQARRQRLVGSFDVNVICVRTVSEKGRIRSKVHEEFIIRTRRAGMRNVFVSRRYGDFRTLFDELRKAHPDEELRLPPAKDKTSVAVTIASPSQSISGWMPSTPTSSTPMSPPRLSRSDTQLSTSSNASVNASRLGREKNRLTLRSYLHSLLSSPTLASSPVLRSFLLSGPTRLTPEEEEDAVRRESADERREEGRRQFAHEVATRVDALRDTISSVKHDMLTKDGIQRVFATIKKTPDAKNLPAEYRAVLEWGRISLASTIFQTFIASDSGSETLKNLKRIHGLIPYMVVKGILKISNPVSMIRGLLDLFLAQPFGGRSLLQRLFTGSLQEEVKMLQEDIASVQSKIEDNDFCEKVRSFVYAPPDVRALFRVDAAAEGQNLWTVVLRASEQPMLNRAQMNRLARAARSHATYLRTRDRLADSDEDDGPQDEDAWLFEDLTVLAKLFARLKEKEDMIAILFEGTTSDLLKDVITIFYSPLAMVYKAANIADSLGDLQSFITDLIRTVEAVDAPGSVEPQRTVQIFISLVERHEQSFYSFVHKVHSKGEALFDDFMRWISLFVTLIRDGLSSEPPSLEFILPHAGSERLAIMKEVDAVAVQHYKLKLAYETKVRKRFARNAATQQEDDAATQALVDGLIVDMSLGDIGLEAPDLADAADANDDDLTDSSEYDSDEYTTASSDEGSEGQPSQPGPPKSRSSDGPNTQSSVSRAQSQSHSRGPAPAARTRASVDLAPQSPKAVRTARSMSLISRRNTSRDADLPPVPPLPNGPPGSRPTLNLNTSMSSHSGTPQGGPKSAVTLGRSSGLSAGDLDTPPKTAPLPGRAHRAAVPSALAASGQPKLEAIPALLPLFVEIMRPHLRVQRP